MTQKNIRLSNALRNKEALVSIYNPFFFFFLPGVGFEGFCLKALKYSKLWNVIFLFCLCLCVPMLIYVCNCVDGKRTNEKLGELI